jgi:hypothetical protein
MFFHTLSLGGILLNIPKHITHSGDSTLLTLAFLKLFFVALTGSITSCNQKKQNIPDKQMETTNKKPVKISNEIPIWTKSIPDATLITGTETYIKMFLFQL